jgi:hypothetical protein
MGLFVACSTSRVTFTCIPADLARRTLPAAVWGYRAPARAVPPCYRQAGAVEAGAVVSHADIDKSKPALTHGNRMALP